jgi:LAS superfamily LD-carboxypeptidase LdcB
LIRTAFSTLAMTLLLGCAEPAAQPAVESRLPNEASAESTHPSPSEHAQIEVGDRWPKHELLGQFDPSVHPGFKRVPVTWTDKDNIYLRTEALSAYGSMRTAAAEDGVQLLIRSATRNFEYQRGIWERKWSRPQYMGWQAVDKARDILTYSAMPGASRHHWGTDIDLNSFENDWFESGEGEVIYAWLNAHARDFGFHQVYDDKSTGRTGYEMERWHWSYLPIAGPMLISFNALISPDDLRQGDFSGANTADGLKVFTDFVNGVDLPPAYRKTDR